MENHGADSELIARIRRISAYVQSLLPPLQPIEEFDAPLVIYDAASRSLAVIQIPTADESDKSGPLPASKASIDALPRITVTDQNCDVEDCAICLEEIDLAGDGGDTREMPCKHGFHSSCIEKWLKIHGSCPVCRFLMPVEDAAGSENNGRRQRSSSDDDDDDEDDGDGDGDENGRRQRRRTITVEFVILDTDEYGSPLASSDSDSGSGEIER